MKSTLLCIALFPLIFLQACGGSDQSVPFNKEQSQVELDYLEAWAAQVLGLEPPVEIAGVSFSNCACERAVFIDSTGSSLEFCSYRLMFNQEAGPQFRFGPCDSAAIGSPGPSGSEELRQAALVLEGLWLTRNFDWDAIARMATSEDFCDRVGDPETIAKWILWQAGHDSNSILVHVIACSA